MEDDKKITSPPHRHGCGHFEVSGANPIIIDYYQDNVFHHHYPYHSYILRVFLLLMVKVSGANPIRGIMPPRTHSLSRPRDQPHPTFRIRLPRKL